MLNITNSIKLKFQKYDLHEFTPMNTISVEFKSESYVNI